MSMTTETTPTQHTRAVDPAANLIRAALAWRHRQPSVGEAHANLMRAASLYEQTNPNREAGDEHERD